MDFISVALAIGKEIVITEPVMTWNLFLTAFLVPSSAAISSGAVMLYMSWRIKKKEKDDKRYREDRELREVKISQLEKELEEEKVKATIEWRKNHMETLCRVKDKVEDIYEALNNKVSKEDCDRLMEKR